MLIGPGLGLGEGGVGLAGSSLFCNKNIYILMILLKLELSAAPDDSLANCISYQLIFLYQRRPVVRLATMQGWAAWLVFNHFFSGIVLLTGHK